MERRKYKRIKSDLDVKIKIAKAAEQKDIEEGKSINISACGVLIQYDKPLKIGALINVRLSEENSDDVFEKTAKVIRVEMNPDNKTYDIGIKFIAIDDNESEKLDKYLQNFEQEIDEEETDLKKSYYYIEIELPDEPTEKQ